MSVEALISGVLRHLEQIGAGDPADEVGVIVADVLLRRVQDSSSVWPRATKPHSHLMTFPAGCPCMVLLRSLSAIVHAPRWYYVAETLGRARICICGRIVVELEGRRLEAGLPGRQGRLLFAYLVANRERIVTRDALAFVAWPTRAPSSADTSLRALLSRLRRLLGPEVLSGRQDLRLELPADAWVDLEIAEARVHEAEAAVLTKDWDRAVVGATIAFQISRRGFLPARTRRGSTNIGSDSKRSISAHSNATLAQASASGDPRSPQQLATRAA